MCNTYERSRLFCDLWMLTRTITMTLVSAIWIVYLVQPASAQAPQGTITIVSTQGVSGTDDVTETVTIETEVGTETFEVTLTAEERKSAIKKAKKIADKIATGANVTAVAEKNVIRIRPRPPVTSLKVVDVNQGKVKQVSRVSPKELSSGSERAAQDPQAEEIKFGLLLTGTATDDDFLGLVEIGGPGGDAFSLNSNSLVSQDILEELATQINQAGNFVATVSDGMLFIGNVTPDNTFLINFEDPELEVIIWVGFVSSPERVPSGLLSRAKD